MKNEKDIPNTDTDREYLDAIKTATTAKRPNLSYEDELEYTASILLGLLDMARARRDQMRAYFMEMAYLETCDQLRSQHAKRQRRRVAA